MKTAIQLPRNPDLCEGVTRLRAVLDATTRTFQPGDKGSQRLNRYDSACVEAVAALSKPTLVTAVDERLAALHNGQNGSAGRAHRTLLDDRPDIYELERRLGRGAGFHDRELAGFWRDARRTLKRAHKRDLPLPHMMKASDLVEELTSLRQLVPDELAASLQKGRRAKRVHRNQCAAEVRRRLYYVSAVIANTDQPHAFNYSYAVGVGAAGTARG